MKENEITNKIGRLEALNDAIAYIKGKKIAKTQKQIAKLLEIDDANLSKALSGNEKYLTESFLRKFADIFNMNADWLLNGEGSMLIIEENDFKKNNSIQTLPVKDGLKPGIPFYNVDFAGGWSSEVLFSEVRPDFYINNPEFDKAEFACNLIGNSVSRRIPNRSIIGLKLIENWQIYFPTNELYGIVMKNELRTVKIVKRSKEKEGVLILVPDPLPEFNVTQYEPEEVPIEFVARFYQIIAWAQFERISM